jgi:hypothetical protein
VVDALFAHPAQDEQLDFGQLGQVDERLDVLLARAHCVLNATTKTRKHEENL